MSTDPYDYTQREEHPKSERTWAMLCHLTALLGYIIPMAHIFAPLIIWYAKKDESTLVRDQGKESVNFQLSLTLYIILIIVLVTFSLLLVPTLVLQTGIDDLAPPYVVGVFGFAILAAIALVLLDIIAVIVASMRASEGIAFRYPLRIRFIK